MLASVVTQFYDDKPPPRLVLLSHRGRGDRADRPRRSRPAPAARSRSPPPSAASGATSSTHAPEERPGGALAQARRERRRSSICSLRSARPSGWQGRRARVEVYDNSHIMGTNAVGGMVVAGRDGFMKSHYRTFNISADTIAGDDSGMMREVLKRRFTRLAKENGQQAPVPSEAPDASVTGALRRQGAGFVGASEAPPPRYLSRTRRKRDTLPRQRLSRRKSRRLRLPLAPRSRHRRRRQGPVRGRRARSWPNAASTDIALVAIAKGEDRNAMRETFFRRASEPLQAAAARSRRCSSSSACATRRTASPSARTAPAASATSPRTRSTRSRHRPLAQAGAASLHFGTVKAIQRAAKLDDLIAYCAPASTPPPPRRCARLLSRCLRHLAASRDCVLTLCANPAVLGECRDDISGAPLRRRARGRCRNLLTYGRIVAIPASGGAPVLAARRLDALGARWPSTSRAAFTDYLDGWIARAWSQQSAIGRMLDPIADKLLVCALLLMLVAGRHASQGWSLWAAIVILCREILVSGLREFLAELKVSVPGQQGGEMEDDGATRWRSASSLAGPAGDKVLPYNTQIGIVMLWLAAISPSIPGGTTSTRASDTSSRRTSAHHDHDRNVDRDPNSDPEARLFRLGARAHRAGRRRRSTCLAEAGRLVADLRSAG